MNEYSCSECGNDTFNHLNEPHIGWWPRVQCVKCKTILGVTKWDQDFQDYEGLLNLMPKVIVVTRQRGETDG